jgi:hypothetical protein
MKATWWMTMIAVLALPLEQTDDSSEVSYQGIHENGQFYAAIAVEDPAYDDQETYDETPEEEYQEEKDATFEDEDAEFETDGTDAADAEFNTEDEDAGEVSWASAFQEIGCTFVDCSQ